MVFSFAVLLSRLQEAKALKKMRIEDISKKSNIPIGTVSKIFAGITTDPKIGTLIAIADALNINIDYLIYGKREINDDATFSDSEQEIIIKYRALDERGKANVLAILEQEYSHSHEAEEGPLENTAG